MREYVCTVSHSWSAVFEADSPEEARDEALAMDEEMPVRMMSTDVEAEAMDERS